MPRTAAKVCSTPKPKHGGLVFRQSKLPKWVICVDFGMSAPRPVRGRSRKCGCPVLPVEGIGLDVIQAPNRGLESSALRDDRQRLCAAHGLIDRQLPEIRLALDRLVEQGGITPPRNLDGAEAAQMLGDILRVEQLESADDQPGHQMHQRHFRGVADAMEHAFAEEGAAEADAVEPADQIVILPDLDAVGVSDPVQADIKIADAL